MKITISAIKADVGSIGGHTTPNPKMMEVAKEAVKDAIKKGLLIDGMVTPQICGMIQDFQR
jgi:fructose 1,6-bisphosphate aldolase/phosphatase